MKFKSLLFLIIGLLLIWLSGRMHKPMQSLRWAGGEPDEVMWGEDADPTVKLVTVMLGPFRGVIADVLWIRVSRLQDEGKYFELVQLADLITKLEPRFPEVWDYHAWNMAYNVSVYFDDPEERWRWVQNGANLIKDEGLKYNPTNAKLHDRLSWIYQHKIGMNSDNAHYYYKQQWFEEMEALIPSGKLGDVVFPPALLEKGAPSPYKLGEYEKMLEEGTISTNVFKLITDYKMRPYVLKKVDEKYGPLDWRLVTAHSLYWASMGLEYSKKMDHDTEQLYRRISQSMMQQFQRGSAIPLPESKVMRFLPELDMVGDVIQSYNDAIEANPDQGTFPAGRKNFFRIAIPLLYLFDREDEARKYYDMMGQMYPSDTRAPFEDFVKRLGEKPIGSINNVEAFSLVVGNLSRAQRIRTTNPVEAAQLQATAQQVFKGYGTRIRGEVMFKRIGLGTWDEMLYAADLYNRATQRPTPLLPPRPTPLRPPE